MLIALVLALLIRTFLLQAFYIDSGSMEPTLMIDDRVLVTKVAYLTDEPRRGEIVVMRREGPDDGAGPLQDLWESLMQGFRPPAGPPRDIIKRIIGLPGETVEMRDGVVYINAVELHEAEAVEGGYLGAIDEGAFGPVTVPQGQYLMMGDNRRWSRDSRNGLGMITREEIVGRAFVTIYPLDRLGLLSS